jgi:hypothetical protein
MSGTFNVTSAYCICIEISNIVNFFGAEKILITQAGFPYILDFTIQIFAHLDPADHVVAVYSSQCVHSRHDKQE